MSAVPSIPAIPPLRVRLPNGRNVTKTVRTVRDRQQRHSLQSGLSQPDRARQVSGRLSSSGLAGQSFNRPKYHDDLVSNTSRAVVKNAH